MTDTIRLIGMRLFTHVGCTPEERAVGQYLEFDVEMRRDLRAATRADVIAESVDYAVAYAKIAAVVAGKEAQLIETLAERAAAAVLALGVDDVTIRVRKAAPPMPHGHVDHAEVEIQRSAER